MRGVRDFGLDSAVPAKRAAEGVRMTQAEAAGLKGYQLELGLVGSEGNLVGRVQAVGLGFGRTATECGNAT